MIRSSTTAVKMARCRKCLQSEYEIECILEDSASEGDNVFQKMKTVFEVKVKAKVKTKVKVKNVQQTVTKQCHQPRKEQRKRVESGL